MNPSRRFFVSVVGGGAVGCGAFVAVVLSISRFGALGWLALPVILVVALILVGLVLFGPYVVSEYLSERSRVARKREVQK